MEAEFTVALQAARDTLQKEGADAALRSVQKFFETRQDEIKRYFDAKSLDETAAEMKARLAQVHALVEPVRNSKPQDVDVFLQALKGFLYEEFHYRAQEMKA